MSDGAVTPRKNLCCSSEVMPCWHAVPRKPTVSRQCGEEVKMDKILVRTASVPRVRMVSSLL